METTLSSRTGLPAPRELTESCIGGGFKIVDDVQFQPRGTATPAVLDTAESQWRQRRRETRLDRGISAGNDAPV